MIDLNANAALLVIDVQKGFDDEEWGPRNNPQAEGVIASLIGFWRAGQLPVVHVRHDSRSPTGHFRPSTPGNDVKAEAEARPGEPVYRKDVNSAFIGTTLENDLRAVGTDTLVVVGLTTNHCVSTTARMAGNLGFRTIVVEDATAAFDRAALDGTTRPAAEVHAAALSDLANEFAEIVDSSEVIAALIRGGAGTSVETEGA